VPAGRQAVDEIDNSDEGFLIDFWSDVRTIGQDLYLGLYLLAAVAVHGLLVLGWVALLRFFQWAVHSMGDLAVPLDTIALAGEVGGAMAILWIILWLGVRTAEDFTERAERVRERSRRRSHKRKGRGRS
jgi:hypothetical protein